jgi:hypothetical protein
VLAYLVTQLQIYSLLESEIDVKGRAYEEIVGSNLRGDRGEFFTPRNICRMAVAMLDPNEKQLVLDPACGTGGFLITAMNHVIEKIRAIELAKWGNNLTRAEEAIKARIRKFAEQLIVGMDFNPELVKAAKMNMVMNNDGSGEWICYSPTPHSAPKSRSISRRFSRSTTSATPGITIRLQTAGSRAMPSRNPSRPRFYSSNDASGS